MSPAARRAARNVMALWLAVLAAAGAAAVARVVPGAGEGPALPVAARAGWAAALDAVLEALPSPGEPEGGPPAWARWALRTAWPVLLGEDEPQSGGTLGRLQAARRVLAALAGFDPGDPVAVLAYQLPGFEAQQGLGGGGAAAARWRFAAGPGPAASSPDAAGMERAPAAAPAGPREPSADDGRAAPGLPPSPPQPPPSQPPPQPPEPQPPTEPPEHAGLPISPLERLQAVAWGDDCRVLIYHTHTSEMYRTDSFAPARPEQYHLFNSTDTGIVRVGRALARRLEELGIPACHVTAVHDWPSHPRAYIEARATVEEFLARHPHVEIVLDVHRDAPSGLVTTVAGRRAAQIAFVVGTNGSMHPDWPRNAEFARALADLLERRHPGLFRRIIERPDARLNQDLHPRAVLVEIGSYDTHLEEAVLSAELFAEVVADMLHVLRFGRSVLDPAPVR